MKHLIRPYLVLLLFAVVFTTGCNEPANKTKNGTNGTHANHTTGMQETNRYADSVNDGLITEDTMKGSPHRVAMGNINGRHIHIEYGSPGVKGRVIWGGVVPYDKLWVTGAHQATNISFSNDVLFGGKKIAAGRYALFTIPGKESWTVILNKNHDQHLADEYSETEDAARVSVVPETKEKTTQRLTYYIKQTGEQQGQVMMQWEKISISVPLRFN